MRLRQPESRSGSSRPILEEWGSRMEGRHFQTERGPPRCHRDASAAGCAAQTARRRQTVNGRAQWPGVVTNGHNLVTRDESRDLCGCAACRNCGETKAFWHAGRDSNPLDRFAPIRCSLIAHSSPSGSKPDALDSLLVECAIRLRAQTGSFRKPKPPGVSTCWRGQNPTVRAPQSIWPDIAVICGCRPWQR
jgi:hypothetical protein